MENQHCKHCGAPDAPNWYYDSDCYFDGERTRFCYKRENERLRTELLACYNVIPGIEQLEKLPDLILSGTVSDTIHAFTLMQEKKAGLLCDALDSAWTLIANVDEGEWEKQQTRGWIECATKWRTHQLTPAWKLVMEHRKKGTPHA